MRNWVWYGHWFFLAAALWMGVAVGTGCDGEGQAAEQTRSEKQKQAASPWIAEPGPTSHRTAIGLSFEVPAGWKLRSSPAAAELRPPGGEERGAGNGGDAEQKEDYMVVLRFAPEGVDSVTDEGYLDGLAEAFAGRVPDAEVVGTETGLESPAGEGARVVWDVQKEGWTKRVAFYVAIERPWMLVVRASAPVERFKALEGQLRSIFATTELRDVDVADSLVGQWGRVEPKEGDGVELGQTMELRANGTMVMITAPAEASGGRRTHDWGRWATREGELVRYAGSHRKGGVWTSAQQWSLEEGGDILRIGEGENAVRWARER